LCNNDDAARSLISTRNIRHNPTKPRNEDNAQGPYKALNDLEKDLKDIPKHHGLS
jgi:hypothetical protein